MPKSLNNICKRHYRRLAREEYLRTMARANITLLNKPKVANRNINLTSTNNNEIRDIEDHNSQLNHDNFNSDDDATNLDLEDCQYLNSFLKLGSGRLIEKHLYHKSV